MFPLPVLGVSASALALLVLLCASAAGSDPDLFSGYVPDDEVQRLQQAHTMHNGVRGIPWKGDGLPWDIVDTPSSYLEELGTSQKPSVDFGCQSDGAERPRRAHVWLSFELVAFHRTLTMCY